jgi:acyl carrier protein
MDQFTELIVQAVSEVLEKPIQASDNFLAAGGNSLQAIRLVTLIEEASGMQLDVVDIFEAPDLSSLSMLVLESRVGDA